MKRVMGIIMGYTVEARPSLKVRAPLEIFNTTEHSFVIDQTTVRWCLREVQGENHQMLEVPNAPGRATLGCTTNTLPDLTCSQLAHGSIKCCTEKEKKVGFPRRESNPGLESESLVS